MFIQHNSDTHKVWFQLYVFLSIVIYYWLCCFISFMQCCKLTNVYWTIRTKWKKASYFVIPGSRKQNSELRMLPYIRREAVKDQTWLSHSPHFTSPEPGPATDSWGLVREPLHVMLGGCKDSRTVGQGGAGARGRWLLCQRWQRDTYRGLNRRLSSSWG